MLHTNHHIFPQVTRKDGPCEWFDVGHVFWYAIYMKQSMRKFTAVYKKSGRWYSGWIEEIPGVNTQGRTIKETKENLKEALLLILETNRLLSRKSQGRSNITRESLAVFA